MRTWECEANFGGKGERTGKLLTRFSSTFAASQKSGSPSLLVISNPLESDFQKKSHSSFLSRFFCRKIKIQSGGFAAFGAKRSETRFASSLTMFFKFSFFHFSTKVDSLFLAVSFPRF